MNTCIVHSFLSIICIICIIDVLLRGLDHTPSKVHIVSTSSAKRPPALLCLSLCLDNRLAVCLTG